MKANQAPMGLVDYSDDMPQLTGTAQEKRQQFYTWMNARYPRDIRMTREQATGTPIRKNGKIVRFEGGWINAPFGHKGAFIATVQADTNARLLKTGNPYPKTRKRSRCQVIGGNWSYKNAVNNARIKTYEQNDGPIFDEDFNLRPPVDGNGEIVEFEPLQRKWGDRVVGSPWVEHKDSLYLELRVLRALNTEYYDEVTGKNLCEETIRPFKPNKHDNSAHQGVSEENEVILRDYGWENVHVIAYAGRNIYIID